MPNNNVAGRARSDAEMRELIREVGNRHHPQVLLDLFTTLLERVGALPSGVDGLEELETGLADLDELVDQRTIISVKEFGALGTLVSENNDTQAFQDAIDFAAALPRGGTVFIPDGAYKITNIEMKTRVTLLGASRSGVVISHVSTAGHTGAMISLDNSGVNTTGLHNFTLNGAGDANLNGISYTNLADTNATNFLDISDANHRISHLDIYGFDDGIGIEIVDGRALHCSHTFISHCTTGVSAGGSDCKWHELDINWCGERGFVCNAGNQELSKVKCWYIGTDDAYETGDAFVINASRCMLTGCQAQDVSRHGIYFNNADNCIIRGQLLDNIGNFFDAQSQGFDHPDSTNIAAVYFDGTATYNSVDFALAQRSNDTVLKSLVFFGVSATNNAVYAHRVPSHLVADGEDVHCDGSTGSTSNNNVVQINGTRLNVSVSSIAVGTDDGAEVIATGAMSIVGTSSNLRNTSYHAYRFDVPDLPQGATIVSARIQWSASGTDATADVCTIDGQDADSSATLTTDVNNLTSRSFTAATVSWDPIPAWVSGERNRNQLSPDLSSIVQEIVDRPGFDGSILIRTTGTLASAGRSFTFFENTGNREATITIVWEEGFVGS